VSGGQPARSHHETYAHSPLADGVPPDCEHPYDAERGHKPVALFQRGKRRTIEQFETMAREWWQKVPQTYPDGTPFPARQPYQDVLDDQFQGVPAETRTRASMIVL
jgi:hypothetical protein